MPTLERRIEALEQTAAPQDGISLIVVQYVRPGDQQPDNHSCEIADQTYTRHADESAEAFDARMVALGNEHSRRAGRPLQIYLSPTDARL